MHVTAHLDVDLLALDREDDVTCLVQLTAPTPDAEAVRPGQGLVVVLDRSGSMAGAPLAGAIDAVCSLVRRLAPRDAFALVTFDAQADLDVPMRAMAQHDSADLERAIRSIRPGGSTDLSAGYLLGLREARRAIEAHGVASATVLLVSDGRANAGISDPDILGGMAATASRERGIVTSTVGFGLGYDEVVLAALARDGNGDHRFAPDVDACVHELAALVGDLLAKSAVGVLVRVRPQPGLVNAIQVRTDLPHWAEDDAVVVGLGDLYAGEERRTLLRLHVPAVASLGLCAIADVTVEFTSLPGLQQQQITMPISVNVVPGDQAAGRIADPLVRVEDLLVDVDAAKHRVATSLRAGRPEQARATLAGAIQSISGARAEARKESPTEITARLDDAARELLRLAHDVMNRPAEHAAKSATSSATSTTRGRRAS